MFCSDLLCFCIFCRKYLVIRVYLKSKNKAVSWRQDVFSHRRQDVFSHRKKNLNVPSEICDKQLELFDFSVLSRTLVLLLLPCVISSYVLKVRKNALIFFHKYFFSQSRIQITLINFEAFLESIISECLFCLNGEQLKWSCNYLMEALRLMLVRKIGNFLYNWCGVL